MTEALGEWMTGVPATTDLHVRNGAVATTFGEARFDAPGNYTYGSSHQKTFQAIAQYLAPDVKPPASAPTSRTHGRDEMTALKNRLSAVHRSQSSR